MEVIKIENLNFSYNGSSPVIESFSLVVEEGETVGIIGPNGAGKTTLLLLIAGLLKGRGTIRVLGWQQPRDFSKIREKIGFLFQDPDLQLFMPRVRDEIELELGRKLESDDDLMSLLREFELADKLERPITELSEGEKKRLAILTVLIKEPELWLLDEPTSSLDPGMRRKMLRVVKKLEGTKIIATHDLDFILEIASKVVLMNRGRKVKVGGVAEILHDENLLIANGLDLPLSLKGVKRWER